MLPMMARGAVGALLRPDVTPAVGALLARGFAAAAAGGGGGLQFCIVGSGPAGFYTADKVCGCGRQGQTTWLAGGCSVRSVCRHRRRRRHTVLHLLYPAAAALAAVRSC